MKIVCLDRVSIALSRLVFWQSCVVWFILFRSIFKNVSQTCILQWFAVIWVRFQSIRCWYGSFLLFPDSERIVIVLPRFSMKENNFLKTFYLGNNRFMRLKSCFLDLEQIITSNKLIFPIKRQSRILCPYIKNSQLKSLMDFVSTQKTTEQCNEECFLLAVIIW